MLNPFLDKKKILENKYAYCFYDAYPVSKGHSLVVPKNDVTEIFELNNKEYDGCFQLVKELKFFLQNKFNPDGFNVGINCGEAAGQTIFVAHIHIIPRYKGDIQKPQGGIRNVIPGKGKY